MIESYQLPAARSRRTAVGWVLDSGARSVMLDCSGFSISVNYFTRKKGAKNGALLAFAGGEFDLFITSDQNIRLGRCHCTVSA